MTKSKEFDDLEEYVEYDDDYDDEYADYEYAEDDESLNANFYDTEDSYMDEDDYNEYDSERNVSLAVVFKILSNIFIKMGIVLAICLLIMFFVTGKVMIAFIYIFGLMVSFSFGYVFMFCVDHFITKSNKI